MYAYDPFLHVSRLNPIMRWVHQQGSELKRRIRRHLKQTNDSWSVDETYIKIKEQWLYLYRVVDSEGNTIDFYLNKTTNHKDANRFFKKTLQSLHVSLPRVITVDQIPAYPIAIEKLKKEKRYLQASKRDNSNIYILWNKIIDLLKDRYALC